MRATVGWLVLAGCAAARDDGERLLVEVDDSTWTTPCRRTTCDTGSPPAAEVHVVDLVVGVPRVRVDVLGEDVAYGAARNDWWTPGDVRVRVYDALPGGELLVDQVVELADDSEAALLVIGFTSLIEFGIAYTDLDRLRSSAAPIGLEDVAAGSWTGVLGLCAAGFALILTIAARFSAPPALPRALLRA